MASTRRSALHDQVIALAASSRELQTQISKSAISEAPLSINDAICAIEKRLDRLSSGVGLSPSLRQELDAVATGVWNTCTQVNSSRWLNGEDQRALCRARAFAFGVLDISSPAHALGHLRALKVAFTATRSCIDMGLHDLALKMMEAAAQRLDSLKNCDTQIEQTHLRSAMTEYYMLRVHMAWLRGRPDIAEHLVSKVPVTVLTADRQVIIETCYDLGSAALAVSQADVAVTWLQRAAEHIQPSMLDEAHQLDSRVNELSLLVRHALVRAYMRSDTVEAHDDLEKQMDMLKADYGDTPSVLFLELDLISRHAQPDIHKYFQVLNTVIQTMDLTDANLRLLFHFVGAVQNQNVDPAVDALRALLTHLLSWPQREWIEKVFVDFVWLLQSSNHPSRERLDIARGVVETLEEHGVPSLSMEAAHAALIPIWKQIDSATRRGDHQIAHQWCCLTLNARTFNSCSKPNRVKIQRKLVTCALHQGDMVLAHEILDQMPDLHDCDPRTLYLSFKLALMEGKSTTEYICPETLENIGRDWMPYLLSNALEAQRLGKLKVSIDSLRRIFEIFKERGFVGQEIHMPAVFMVSICLVREAMEHRIDASSVRFLVWAIEKSLTATQTTALSRVSAAHLEWLYSESYKLALKLLQSSWPELVSSMLNISKTVCLCSLEVFAGCSVFPGRDQIVRLYGDAADSQHITIVEHHLLLCDYLNVLSMVLQARTQSMLDIQDYYSKIRSRIYTLSTKIQSHLNDKTEAEEKQEWISQYRNLICLDFEAAIFLKQWDCLVSLIQEVECILDERSCMFFMDSILRTDVPLEERIAVVKSIICTAHTSSSQCFDKASFRRKLPRYLRVLFELAITPTPQQTHSTSIDHTVPEIRAVAADLSLAEWMLDEVLLLAAEACAAAKTSHADENDIINTSQSTQKSTHSHLNQIKDQQTTTSAQENENPYPSEELEWLSTVSFNQAVEFYRAARDEECRRWAEKAIRLAELTVSFSGNALVELLQRKLQVLLSE